MCGASDGALNIYNWNEFGDLSDRFPGHPQSVDCCVALTDSIVFTGSMDGMIRWVKLFTFTLFDLVLSDYIVMDETIQCKQTHG